jgi:hypothetical protein
MKKVPLKRIGVLAIALLAAQSVIGGPRTVAEFMELMDNVKTQIAALNGPTAGTYCSELARTGTSSAQNNACYQTYKNFYQNSDVNISIALGYGDTRPKSFVRDSVTAMALRRQLTDPCIANYNSCGFTQSPDDAEMLLKTITGPDGRPKTIHLRLTNPSLSTNDYGNRDKDHLAAQQAKSAASRAAFQHDLANSDAVFYLGHSRGGGGPDFSSPVVDGAGHPRYADYQFSHPGLNDLLNNINAPPRKLKMLGMFSCDSQKHFYDKLHGAAPGLGLVTTNSIIGDGAQLRGALGALNGLVGMKCQQNFSGGVDPGDNTVGVHNFMGI